MSSFAFPQAGLDFLQDLAANNSKDWFQANKKRYERDLKGPARALVDAINEELLAVAPEYVTPPGKAINRINRDIRFSKDKTPYNTRVWAGFHHQELPKGSAAGFYFGFSVDGGTGVGAGVWAPAKEKMEALRAHFAEHVGRYRKIMGAKALADFEVGASDAYKRVPKPYPADHPAADLLKLKGFHVKRTLDEGTAIVTTPQLVATVSAQFKALKPLVDFLNAGLAGG